MRPLTEFPVLLCFFRVALIIFLTHLFTCIRDRGLFSFFEALFSLHSRFLLGFWGGLFLLTRVLLDFWEGLLMFVFSSLEPVFSSNNICLSGICNPSNIGFSLKFWSIVIALEVMSIKIIWSSTQKTLFLALDMNPVDGVAVESDYLPFKSMSFAFCWF